MRDGKRRHSNNTKAQSLAARITKQKINREKVLPYSITDLLTMPSKVLIGLAQDVNSRANQYSKEKNKQIIFRVVRLLKELAKENANLPQKEDAA